MLKSKTNDRNDRRSHQKIGLNPASFALLDTPLGTRISCGDTLYDVGVPSSVAPQTLADNFAVEAGGRLDLSASEESRNGCKSAY